MGLFRKKVTVNMAINTVRTSENTYLVDCREKETFKSGHISGAISFPIDKMTEENIRRRFPDKTAHIFVIGSYTQRPGTAVRKFRKMGYKKAESGGYMEEHQGMLVK